MLNIPLQPLRIPSQWTVEINNFTQANPSEYSDTDDEVWFSYFIEDLLYLTKEALSIDLGWYPEGNSNGQFRLLLIQDNHWENPLREFCSVDKQEIVETLEKWLMDLL